MHCRGGALCTVGGRCTVHCRGGTLCIVGGRSTVHSVVYLVVHCKREEVHCIVHGGRRGNGYGINTENASVQWVKTWDNL